MAHPQSSPRGLWAKGQLDVVTRLNMIAGAGIEFDDYSDGSNLLTANSTALLVAGQVRTNGQKYVGSNSTGFIFSAAAALPGARSSAKWVFITNSTGVNAVAVNTTGTTWKYLNVTSKIPT